MEVSSKNWNNLPVELKMMCIGRMHFLTRWNLRSTAHSEKRLVDSQKICMEKMSLDIDEKDGSLKMTVISDDESSVSRKFDSGSTHSVASVLGILLNNGEVNQFRTDYLCQPVYIKWLTEIVGEICTEKRFKVKYFVMNTFCEEYLRFIHNCVGLKKILVEKWNTDRFFFSITLPAPFSKQSPELECISFASPHDLMKILENWMENPSDVGFHFLGLSAGWKDFAGKAIDQFPERLVDEKLIEGDGETRNSERIALFTTSDPRKQILVENECPTVDIHVVVATESIRKVDN